MSQFALEIGAFFLGNKSVKRPFPIEILSKVSISCLNKIVGFKPFFGIDKLRVCIHKHAGLFMNGVLFFLGPRTLHWPRTLFCLRTFSCPNLVFDNPWHLESFSTFPTFFQLAKSHFRHSQPGKYHSHLMSPSDPTRVDLESFFLGGGVWHQKLSPERLT